MLTGRSPRKSRDAGAAPPQRCAVAAATPQQALAARSAPSRTAVAANAANASAVLLQLNAHPAVLNDRLAATVSRCATATRLSLRVAALVVEAVFELARFSAATSFSLSRRALVTAVQSAKLLHVLRLPAAPAGGLSDETFFFVKVLDKYTNLGIYFIHHVFSLAELLTMTTFHATAAGVQFSIQAAEETVRIFDGLFGSNETSRALSAFICLVKREITHDTDLGSLARRNRIAAFGSITKALIAYCCLQYVNYARVLDRMGIQVIFEGVPDDVPECARNMSASACSVPTPPTAASLATSLASSSPLPAMHTDSDLSDSAIDVSAQIPRETTKAAEEIENLLIREDQSLDGDDEADSSSARGRVHCRSSTMGALADVDDVDAEDEVRNHTTATARKLMTALRRLRLDDEECDEQQSRRMSATANFNCANARKRQAYSAPTSPNSLRASPSFPRMCKHRLHHVKPASHPASPVPVDTHPDNCVADSSCKLFFERSRSDSAFESSTAATGSSTATPISSRSSSPIEGEQRLPSSTDNDTETWTADEASSPEHGVTASTRQRKVRSLVMKFETIDNSNVMLSKRTSRIVIESTIFNSTTTLKSANASPEPESNDFNAADPRASEPPPLSIPPRRSSKRHSPISFRSSRPPSAAADSCSSHHHTLPPLPTATATTISSTTVKSTTTNKRGSTTVVTPTSITRDVHASRSHQLHEQHVHQSCRGQHQRSNSMNSAPSVSILYDLQPTHMFPRGALLKNSYRYMRYSSGAYGHRLMRILGIGKIRDIDLPAHHHGNLAAFAAHTGTSIEHIVSSSYSAVSSYFSSLSSTVTSATATYSHTSTCETTIASTSPPSDTLSTSPSMGYSYSFSQPESSGSAPPSSSTALIADAPSIKQVIHYLSVDHDTRSVVLALRGTLGLSDVLTDLICHYAEFWVTREVAEPSEGTDDVSGPRKRETFFAGHVHAGMLQSAMQLIHSPVFTALRDVLLAHPTYGLVLCGHSLGAGVASLLGLMFAKETPNGEWVLSEESGLPCGRDVHVYAYGPPGVMSPELAKRCAKLITAVVHAHDIVPALSLGLIRDFKNVAINLADEENIAEAVISKVLGIFRTPRDVVPLTSTCPRSSKEDESHWFWSLLKTLRADMCAEKLLPPGTVYRAREAGAKRVVLERVSNVEESFGQILFSRTMLSDHAPSGYEAVLERLYKCGIARGVA